MREMRKHPGEIEQVDDPSFPVVPSWFYDNYLKYRDRNILPRDGGWSDQDPAESDALKIMDHMVAWHIENEKKPAGLQPIESVYKKRRANLMNR